MSKGYGVEDDFFNIKPPVSYPDPYSAQVPPLRLLLGPQPSVMIRMPL